ncbi:1-phosphatidylinositol 3-phosphate 5-kinase [Venturia nashicola]|nr:1-phosphatidylinositol 3-phosphate 5-kinase [Venturia nashicola]
MALPILWLLHIAVSSAVSLLTIVATASFSTWSRNIKKDLYEDEDGVATPESQQAYSTRVQNLLATTITSAGLGVAIANAVLASLSVDAPHSLEGNAFEDGWFGVAIWFLLALLRVQVLREPYPYNLTLTESICFLLTATLHTLSVYFISNGSYSTPSTNCWLITTDAALAICGFSVCITYPRRPQLFYQGKEVDGCWSVSAFMGYTYSWPSGLLALSAKGKELEYDDMPTLGHLFRTRQLFDAYQSVKHHGQHLLTAIDALLMIAPQYAMYRLLRLLELRDSGADIANEAYFWVAGLGIFIAAGGFSNNWLWWVCYSLNITIRAQLSGLIFAKSMRRKDIKGVVAAKEKNVAVEFDPEETDHAQPQAQPEKPETSAEDIEEGINKTRQGVVNLIGVDATRVSQFSTVMNMFLGATSRLILSFIFLGKLLGWIPLVSGIAVQLLTLPLNIYFSKKYTNGQKVLMEQRDRKLAVINEALGGIRQIKFAALERQWQKRIMDVREDELKALWKNFLYDVVLITLWLAGPVLLSAVCIIVYAVINGGLPPSIAFTTISILGQIEGTLAWLPELTTNMLDAYVSLKRIGDYLDGPEKIPVTIPGEQISFKNVSVSWPSENGEDKEIFTLRNVNFTLPKGELSVISGRTGSGKSLLLAAILGEVEVFEGAITVPLPPSIEERRDDKANKGNWILPNALAFVSQQPWIENATLKNNILFGLPYDEQRYNQVISSCALEQDLKILTDGHETEIGVNGINLSGGQRWRITLARALYSRAGILVLDDIFSAVDAHVGKHIFERALTGDICKGRTRILVTHHVSLVLPRTKYEVHLGDGTATHAGFVTELERNGELEAIIDDEEDDDYDDEGGQGAAARFASIKNRKGSTARRHSSSATNVSAKNRSYSHSSATSDIIDSSAPASNKDAPKKFVEDEARETGWIKFSVYKAYLNACGGLPFWLVVAITFGGYEGLLLGRSWVLRLWTENYDGESIIRAHFIKQDFFAAHTASEIKARDASADLKFYLAIYLGFAVAICVEGSLRYLWVFYGSIKASRALFDKLTYAVLRAPLRWLDTMPVGRVLNRFTADFNQVDSQQAYNFAFCLYNAMLVVGIVIAGIIVSPYIILAAIILLSLCSRYALYYLATARQTKRLESTAKSPVFELFTTALAGVSTLRAFDKTQTYITNMFGRVDTHARSLYYQWLLNRWLSWRLSVIGAVFSVIVATLIVSLNGLDAALGGFALGFTLQYTEAVTWLLRNFAGVEIGMNAVERVIEYSEIATEDEEGFDAPAAWPTDGRLEVHNLAVGYAPDLPSVLKGVSFSVERNERIGIIGRTGSGKSSLTLALFRFLEAREGSIHIDGIDISKIKLHDLRSRIAIIPQDPVLFSGTIRSNLDPFDEHSDQELRDALQRVHLLDSVPTTEDTSGAASTSDGETGPSSPNMTKPNQKNSNPFTSLTSPISESGLNLSQGQRQLLCLARAIVARPKIMILDEATSAVDKTTDALIQRSIREEFQDSTLLVIAHRLSTIVDFDRILVLGGGEVVEFGAPWELLAAGEEREGGFRGMVESSGEREILREIIGEGGR